MSDHCTRPEHTFDTDTLAPGLLPGVAWSQFEPSGLLTDLLSSLDVGRLDADDALETAAAWERLVAHAQAPQFRALARFASLQEGPDSDEFAADEVPAVLRVLELEFLATDVAVDGVEAHSEHGQPGAVPGVPAVDPGLRGQTQRGDPGQFAGLGHARS